MVNICCKKHLSSDRIISRLYESYDRTGMNKDGCDGTNCTDSILHGRVNNPLGTTDRTYEYILFSTEIPTVFKRFWLTDFPAGTLLRFYFDGKKIPAISRQPDGTTLTRYDV